MPASAAPMGEANSAGATYQSPAAPSVDGHSISALERSRRNAAMPGTVPWSTSSVARDASRRISASSMPRSVRASRQPPASRDVFT